MFFDEDECSAAGIEMVAACLNFHSHLIARKEPSPIRDFFSAIIAALMYNVQEYDLSYISSESGANIRTTHSRDFFRYC